MTGKDNILKINEIDKGILEIRFNRPTALNSINHLFLTLLEQHLQHIKHDNTIKAILLTGEGKAFCAGADIGELVQLTAINGREFALYGQKIFRMIEELGKPSLAAINGFALGGGCELAMAATVRIAAKTAVFGQPEVKLGVLPGFGGTQRLARYIGKGRALELCLTGRLFKADDAYNWGLVSEVVPLEELSQRALEWLQQIIKLSPLAQKGIMTVIDRGYDLSLEDALELEAVHFGLCCATQDKKEGTSAFLEKREAKFLGE